MQEEIELKESSNTSPSLLPTSSSTGGSKEEAPASREMVVFSVSFYLVAATTSESAFIHPLMGRRAGNCVGIWVGVLVSRLSKDAEAARSWSIIGFARDTFCPCSSTRQEMRS